MRLFRVLTVLLSLAIAGSALAQTGSGVHDDRWYLGGSLGYVDLDRDRLTESSDIVYGINIGRFFLPRLSLDLRLDRYEPSFLSAPAGTSRDFDLMMGAISLVRLASACTIRLGIGRSCGWKPNIATTMTAIPSVPPAV